MLHKPFKVSVLIPVYNRIEITKKGLNSVYEALGEYKKSGERHVEFEIIVIDDGSTDGTSEWIMQTYPKIHIEKGNGNLWWSGSINKGALFAIKELKTDYILLWNDDVYPEINYFKELALIVKTNPKNIIIGSLIYILDSPNKIWSAGGMFNPFSGKLHMLKDIRPELPGRIFCDWQPGMGTLIDADLIIINNLWWDDKNFPQYFGDSDFVLRAKKIGANVQTNIRLIAYNNTETTGYKGTNRFSDLILAFKSIKSIFNIKKNFLFYARHGIIPFVFYGMVKKFGGYIARYVNSKF